MDDYNGMIYDGRKFMGCEYIQKCLVRVGPDKYPFLKPNNRVITNYSTNNIFKKLLNDYLLQCVKRLIKIGFLLPMCIHAKGYQEPIQYTLLFSNPKRNIPSTNPTDYINMSPVEGGNFHALRLMQNIHQLTGFGGVNKYVCKYVGKLMKTVMPLLMWSW